MRRNAISPINTAPSQRPRQAHARPTTNPRQTTRATTVPDVVATLPRAAPLPPPIPLVAPVVQPLPVMGDMQRILMTRDVLRATFEACTTLDALCDAFAPAAVTLAELPTRTAVQAARRATITATLAAGLDCFGQLEDANRRARGLFAFAQAWRQLDADAADELAQALADTAFTVVVEALTHSDTTAALLEHLHAVPTHQRTASCIERTTNGADALAAHALLCAALLPDITPDDVQAVLAACQDFGAKTWPADARARLWLQTLLVANAYDLHTCTAMLQQVVAGLGPTPVPQTALPARRELVSALQTWVELAPAALPPLSPYQLHPLVAVLTRLGEALGVQLSVELETPDTQGDAAMAARLAADDT